jgi:DNA-binding NtrC family response regulator
MSTETLQDTKDRRRSPLERAGVVVVFSCGRPTCMPFPLDGRTLVLGRSPEDGASIDDPRMSRRHAEVSLGPTGWLVRDLGSRNGTHAEGRAVPGTRICEKPPVLRFGSTVAIAVHDVLPFLAASPMRAQNTVLGPTWRTSLAEIAAVAASQADLLVTGETGCGKELAAAHFHATGPRARGPFVAVNCAAIPSSLAERLLFGNVKGAYSGASAEAQGYVQAAEGGVLFLDEFGELDLEVQGKLLRVLETKETLPVGASQSRRVDTRFCLATNRDLRVAMANGAFRSDLYYRVAQSVVALAPLRERREEIPWLAQLAVEQTGSGLALGADLVEACLLRPWPGNVRELLGEVRRIARVAQSRASTTIPSDLLAPHAGHAPEEAAHRPRTPVTSEQIRRALREASSVSAAARSLGIHRSHLYRLLRDLGIEPDVESSSGH